MESTCLNVPQMFVGLTEKSDKLIRDNVKKHPQENEWFKIIREMAQKIADGGFTSCNSTSPGGTLEEFKPSSIPSCMTLVKGEAEKQVSSIFPNWKRDHLHGKKSINVSGRKTDSRNEIAIGKKMRLSEIEKGTESSARPKTSHTPSGKPSLRNKKNSARVENELDSVNAGNTCLTPRRVSTKGKENSANFENGAVSRTSSGNRMTPKNASTKSKIFSAKVENFSDCMIIDETRPASEVNKLDRTFVQPNSDSKFVTPQKIKNTPSQLKSKRRSSRSSGNLSKTISLEQEMFQKKLKAHSREPHLVTRSSRFSMGKKKYSGLKETRQPSGFGARCSSKASVTLKKEMLQCKEDLATENLKKLQDARRIQIEEKKKKRDEKMERTKEKRRQLEEAKNHSTKKKTAETVTRSTRRGKKSAERVTRSREPKASEATADSKRKTPVRSEIKKTTSPLKIASSRKTPALSKPISPSKSPPAKKAPASSRTPRSMKSKEPKVTPIVISLKEKKVTPNPTIISLQNTTVTFNKETENNDSLKKTPTSPLVPKVVSKLKAESMYASGQKVNKSSSPSSSKKETLGISKAQSSNKKPDSYELTPDRSSFTSYDISEIKSDDDDDEESSTQKPIPSWAVGLRLRNALIHQYYNPIDTDELFGKVCNPPDLEQMFNVKKKSYCKRTSSAIWQSPRAFR